MNDFTFRQSGSRGCEILAPDGTVVAWTTNEIVAMVIVALLNRVERKGSGAVMTD